MDGGGGGMTYTIDSVRGVLAKHLNTEIRSGAAFEYFAQLVDRHPNADEKRGSGIAAFRVRPNAMNRSAFELLLVRRDGSVIDVSWRKCVKGVDVSHKARLRKAMRSRVADQVIFFRDVTLSWADKCALCGVDLERGKMHVDHVIPFETLAGRFCDGRTDIPTRFGDDPFTHTTTFRPEDGGFALDWANYHQIHAVLRGLCPPCNMARGVGSSPV